MGNQQSCRAGIAALRNDVLPLPAIADPMGLKVAGQPSGSDWPETTHEEGTIGQTSGTRR
jgi:hypothetical protein